MSSSSRDRPAVAYQRGRMTALLRVLGPTVAVIGVATILVGYATLPATVPTHFGVDAEADSFGPRWSVLVLAGIWVVVQLGVALLAAHPRWFNYPMPVTAGNAQRLYREGERMMVWLGVAVAATFAGLTLSVFDAGGGPLIVLGLAATVVAMIVGVTRLLRAG